MATSILDDPAIRKRAFSFSVSQYHSMVSNESTELIKGQVIKKMPKSPLHTFFLEVISNYLRKILPSKFIVRQEAPISSNDSEPEPDISIVEGPIERYFSNHPRTAILVIEISLSTLELDRAKAIIYAEAKVPEYWIVRPDIHSVEIFSEPEDGQYKTKKELTFEEEIFLFENRLQLKQFLPKK